MNTKYITVKVDYDSEETWEVSLEEISEIIAMMNNLKRNAKIIDIADLLEVNNNDDGQDK